MRKISGTSRVVAGRHTALACLAGVSMAGLMAYTPLVYADEAPPGTVPTLEQLKPVQPIAKDTPASAVPDQGAMPRELGKPSDDITLDVTAYSIDDTAPAALREALPALTAPFVGKQRSYEDLVNAASAVTRFMQRELGYYLGYAYLPEQTPKDGVIRIGVLEGRLDEVILKWPDKMPVRKEVVEDYLSQLQPGAILKVRDVERVVFMINDLYGLRARFEVKSGRTPGTASLVVTPTAEARLSGRVELDMNGSRYSGEYRLTGVASVASPLGRGDNLTVSGLASTTGGLQFGLVSYATPVGRHGLKLGASASAVKYQLDKDIFQLDLHGKANAYSVFGLYPVIRSRNLNTFALATLEHKEYTDSIAGLTSDKRTRDLQLGIVGDFRDNWLTGGVNSYELNWWRGNITVKPGTLAVPNNFNKYGLGFSRLQNIINGRLLGYVRYKGQIAGDNLDTTERFGLGGASGVRAYAPGEGTADTAHLLTTELRWLPPESMFGRVAREMVFSAFYDLGVAKVRHDLEGVPSITDNTPTLGGAGFGFVWDRPQSFAFRMSLAWATQGEAVNDKKERNPRVYAVFTKSL
ncbi:MAG TPA: ShlB/FhaC/HecB family hemolysin secretion/activation protein [Aquabacterium sp.]|uniref:ShlB/FhaC/HecB family hemolysin secretion/activation protein n=1 Tax=Aquabacterium sp. TaxID=1872578 RepID=UPI002E2EEF49|nr:ShlB/FhaC/HecB family hemolysin secretion/activation protein [Aquabacterium sp.]HEX5371884.1 ShlB/FhaC/HecB family hemolysin secretion/activation protein [Aquabacterium sp.]